MSEFVNKEFCNERHKSIDDKDRVAENRLNDHAGRIKSVEQAVIVLTEMVKAQAKRNIFDKVLIVSVFVMCLVVAGIVLGPEITGKMIGGIK